MLLLGALFGRLSVFSDIIFWIFTIGFMVYFLSETKSEMNKEDAEEESKKQACIYDPHKMIFRYDIFKRQW